MNPTVISVIDYITEKYSEFNSNKSYNETVLLTGNRTQKLLYLCQVEYIKKYNTLMFEESFYTWPSGPVISYLYHYVAKLCKNNLQDTYKLDKQICDVIDEVILSTINVNTLDLDKQVKNDGLWEKYYNKYDERHIQTIPNNEMLICHMNISKTNLECKGKQKVRKKAL